MRFKSASNEGGEIINISSMIDVMFILIIFFLVTTTFKEEEIDHLVNLPTDKRNQSMSQLKGNVIKINIRENGSYNVMGTQMTEEQLTAWMEGRARPAHAGRKLQAAVRETPLAAVAFVAQAGQDAALEQALRAVAFEPVLRNSRFHVWASAIRPAQPARR